MVTPIIKAYPPSKLRQKSRGWYALMTGGGLPPTQVPASKPRGWVSEVLLLLLLLYYYYYYYYYYYWESPGRKPKITIIGVSPLP